MQLKKQGMAMVLALSAMVIVAGLGTLMFSRTMGETRSSGDSATVVKNLMLARGAMTFAGAFMESTGKSLINNAVTGYSSTTDAWAFGGNGANPVAATVATKLDLVAINTQTSFDNVLCSINFAPTGTSATVKLRIFFVTNPAANANCTLTYPTGLTLPEGRFIQGSPRSTTGGVDQSYAMPFVAVAQSELGQYKRNIVLQGEYRFSFSRTSFARYAFFANLRQSGLYFVDNVLVDGPAHSNQYLRFLGKPWFGDKVTVAGCVNPTLSACGTQNQGDDFGGTIKTVAQIGANGGPCFGSNCPTFVNNQYNFSSAFIPLPDANQARVQRQAAQGGGALAASAPYPALPAQPANTGGLYFNSTLARLNMYAGDANGNAVVGSAANPPVWSAATHQYVVACTSTTSTTCTLYRSNSTGTLQKWSGSAASTCPDGVCGPSGTGSWDAVNNTQGQAITSFNGVIYADGAITVQGPPRTAITGSTVCTAALAASNPDCASPALASFSQITVANSGTNKNIVINRDIKYASPPCTGSPTRASVSSPVTLATCNNMSATNVLGIYSQDSNVLFGPTSSRPTNITIHGVVMSGTNTVQVNNYSSGGDGGELRLLGGMIGNTVSGFKSGSNGYERRLTYDRRLAGGLAPPFFPTTSQTEVLDTFTFTFGQREQVGLQ